MKCMEPLYTPAEMAAIDSASPSLGVAGPLLMENAGRAVARAIRRRVAPCRVVVLAGPGNNGGDGYVAARYLAQEGWPVTVTPLAPPRAGSDAEQAAEHWRGPVAQPSQARIHGADLVIDAVFGAGLSREVTGEVVDLLAAARRLVAVDMPSGIDGATGQIRGYAPRAALTVTFLARKPGHLLLPGRDMCGETVVADIGTPPRALDAAEPKTFRNAPGLFHLSRPAMASHKYDRGHVTILGGALAGASILAAMAARRVGAGLVTIAAERAPSAPPGIMIRSDGVARLAEDSRRKVWLCGPGLGADAAGDALATLIAAGKTIVADADALTACAGAPEKLRGVAAITPHRGEFGRVFGVIGDDRLGAARAAAANAGAVVVLKGPDTVIASPDGRAAINDNAPPSLATAGTGDTLAGMITGLLGQGMEVFEACCAAVWLHGAAARIAGDHLIAEDLADALPAAMTRAVVAAPPSAI